MGHRTVVVGRPMYRPMPFYPMMVCSSMPSDDLPLSFSTKLSLFSSLYLYLSLSVCVCVSLSLSVCVSLSLLSPSRKISRNDLFETTSLCFESVSPLFQGMSMMMTGMMMGTMTGMMMGSMMARGGGGGGGGCSGGSKTVIIYVNKQPPSGLEPGRTYYVVTRKDGSVVCNACFVWW